MAPWPQSERLVLGQCEHKITTELSIDAASFQNAVRDVYLRAVARQRELKIQTKGRPSVEFEANPELVQ